jgi:tRNA (guanine10-N2)-dimethyltransferase
MSSFNEKSLCVLGRLPKLGLVELESLYGAPHVKPLAGAALLDLPAEDINFKRLGGTIKTARVLARLPYKDWHRLVAYLRAAVPEHLQGLPEGKFTLGVSVYGLNVSVPEINRSLLAIKKLIKDSGRPVRAVPNKTSELSSAQVLHNKLTHKGSWELILMADGHDTIIAQTLFVQDIDAYAGRDQARPARDAKVGMLPPKLAQTIINLAEARENPNVRILDPFCGTGVLLQEALLMGYSVFGTDIDPRMIDFSKRNIQWLVRRYPAITGSVVIEPADATSYRWSRFTAIASEVYLGRPLNKLPDDQTLKKIISDTNTITSKFLNNLAPQLEPGRKLCLAVPAWQKSPKSFIRLPLLAKLTDMGYNIVNFKHVRDDELVYFRENQVVARQILVLKKAE